MSISELLRSEEFFDVRVTCGYRWLYFDNAVKDFVVCERLPHAKRTRIICRTISESYAIEFLIGGKDE